MERLVRNAIVDHMIENNIFSTSQHGFISGKSCITQLLEFMEDITESIDNGKDVDIVYLDCSKAFDNVAHRRLIKKTLKIMELQELCLTGSKIFYQTENKE